MSVSIKSVYPELPATFLAAVERTSARLGIRPEWLLAVMDFETAGTFSPSKRNPTSGAVGLIQFMESTARAMGTTTDELAALSQVEQLRWVERYLADRIQERGPLRTLADVYMAVLWPAAIGKPDAHVLFRRGSAAYAANSGLDRAGDGTVTKADAVHPVAARLRVPESTPFHVAGAGSDLVTMAVLIGAMSLAVMQLGAALWKK